MAADLILVNGTVYTFDAERPRASAIAFEGGRIAAVGEDASVLEEKGARTEIVDLRGRTVIPGPVDSHIHFTGLALSLERVNLEGARSMEEAAARVGARARQARPGEWIRGHSWNHNEWEVRTFPTKGALDGVTPANPVVLTRKDGHSMWLNSAALAAIGVTRDTPDPAGGRIERDADGEPTGLLRENAMALTGAGIGTGRDEIPAQTLKRAIAEAHRLGLTGIHNIEGANALRAFQNLRRAGELDLRVIHFIPSGHLEAAVRVGLQEGLGDEWLQVAGVKIFADGSLGSQTAAMLEPYEGSADNRGIIVTPKEEMRRLARLAAENGLAVAIHAIGDAAIRTTLDIFQELREAGLSRPVFRVEHAQHLTREDIGRFAALDVIASVQPIHQPSDMLVADRLIGKRARWTYPFRSLLDAGAKVAFGSDCPVETLDPLRGIHAAVTRRNERGEPEGGWYPEERISVAEAVRAYTLGGDFAATAGGERWQGTRLREGERGDCVTLSADIFHLPPEEILNTRVETTVVGGRVVYTA